MLALLIETFSGLVMIFMMKLGLPVIMRHLCWLSLDPNLFDVVEVHVNAVINISIASLLPLPKEFILLINLLFSRLFVFQQLITLDTELYRSLLMNSLY